MSRPKTVFAIAIIVIGFICFLDTVFPTRRMVHVPENQPAHVPAPMNSSLGFGKLYYISLPSRTDRQDHMSLAFYVSGLTPAELIPGVIGTDIEEKARPLGGANLSPGALGTWRAHMDAWKKMLNDGRATALILEDDVDWHVDVKQQFNLMSTALKDWRSDLEINDVTDDYPYGTEWDILMVGQYQEHRFDNSEESYYIYADPTVLPFEAQTATNRQTLEDFEVPPGHRVLSRSKGPTGMQGYAVTREGAARLMHLIGVNNVTHAVDIEVMWFCYWRRLRCLEVSPALIGMYILPGSSSDKISDNNAPGWEPESENPIGPQSVKAMMSDRLDPNLDRDV